MSGVGSAIAEEGGRLRAATYHFDADLPRDIPRIDLEFEHGQWSVLVHEDDDTVRLVETAAIGDSGLRTVDAAALAPWRDAIGRAVRWVWFLENQQGYADAIQFEFTDISGGAATIQILAVASRLNIQQVRSIEPHPSPPSPAGNSIVLSISGGTAGAQRRHGPRRQSLIVGCGDAGGRASSWPDYHRPRPIL